MISWCTKAGHGSRLMPPGTITGAHFVSTDNYIQLTGRANLRNMCVVVLLARADSSQQPQRLQGRWRRARPARRCVLVRLHGLTDAADGLGNPIGSLLFSTALQPGSSVPVQAMEWCVAALAAELTLRRHMFLEEDRFCLKACRPSDNNAAADCPHIYDEYVASRLCGL